MDGLDGLDGSLGLVEYRAPYGANKMDSDEFKWMQMDSYQLRSIQIDSDRFRLDPSTSLGFLEKIVL